MSEREKALKRYCPLLMVGLSVRRYCDRQCAWYVERLHGCAFVALAEAAESLAAASEKKNR